MPAPGKQYDAIIVSVLLLVRGRSMAVMTTQPCWGARRIEVKYSAAEYRFLYSGLVDPWWSTRRNRLREMFRASPVGNVE